MCECGTAGRVLYVATGKPYLKVAALSVSSLRRVFSGPITLLLTEHPPTALQRRFDQQRVEISVQDVGTPDDWLASRRLKTQLPKYCNDELCLFVDADTLIHRSIDTIWDYPTLSAPLAMPISYEFKTVGSLRASTHMRRVDFAADFRCTYDHTGAAFPYYTSSTMVWRRTQALVNLFAVWHAEFERFKSCDMLPLARAVHRTQLPIVRLPADYCVRNQWKTSACIYTARYPVLLKQYAHQMPNDFNAITDALEQSAVQPALQPVVKPKAKEVQGICIDKPACKAHEDGGVNSVLKVMRRKHKL